MNIENISRFGRSFSVLKVPYAFKLLIQELQVMNVQMRIITDQNVDQLLSMSYSNNIIKLINPSITIDNEQSKDKSMEIMKLNEIVKLNNLIMKPDNNSENINDEGIKNIPDYAPNMPDIYKSDQQQQSVPT